MNARSIALASVAVQISAAAFAGWLSSSKISFTRTVPPTYTLESPIRSVAVINMPYSECASLFPSRLGNGIHIDIRDQRRWKLALRDVAGQEGAAARSAHPADAYAAAEFTKCSAVRASDGYEGRATVTLHMVNTNGQPLPDLVVSATTDRDDSDAATAKRDAGENAGGQTMAILNGFQESVTVELDPAAPGVKDSAALLKASDFAGLRKSWEALLATNGHSAGLHYNLGAVTEALGDNTTAIKEYREAIRLDSNSDFYKLELHALEGRFENLK